MAMAISETYAPTSWQKMAADWFQLDAYALYIYSGRVALPQLIILSLLLAMEMELNILDSCA